MEMRGHNLPQALGLITTSAGEPKADAGAECALPPLHIAHAHPIVLLKTHVHKIKEI
jgi:hypothetical protein